MKKWLMIQILKYLLAEGIYKKSLISVEGYDVKRLCNNYKLSQVGVYNFLIYLRENHKEALADLVAGLPRK